MNKRDSHHAAPSVLSRWLRLEREGRLEEERLSLIPVRVRARVLAVPMNGRNGIRCQDTAGRLRGTTRIGYPRSSILTTRTVFPVFTSCVNSSGFQPGAVTRTRTGPAGSPVKAATPGTVRRSEPRQLGSAVQTRAEVLIWNHKIPTTPWISPRHSKRISRRS